MFVSTEKASRILHQIVDEYGRDHVYRPPMHDNSRCLYAARDNDAATREVAASGDFVKANDLWLAGKPVGPGCLIGMMLHRMGMSLTELAALDQTGGIEQCIAADLVTTDTDLLAMALGKAQAVQDHRGTWGAAVDTFDRFLLPTPPVPAA